MTKTLTAPSDRNVYPLDVVVSSLSNRQLTSPTAQVEDKVTIEFDSLRII